MERNDIDACFVITPDHWHVPISLDAVRSGKDVYVEKPLTLFAREGRWMIDVAKRHGSVVQVGTQQRSGGHYARARQLIRDGHIGRVMSVQMSSRSALPKAGTGITACRDDLRP